LTRRRSFKVAATLFLVGYSIVTLFPFYVLSIRTFVGTKDSGDLHLWLPPEQDVAFGAPIGTLAASKGLDLKQVKADLGIDGYLNPNLTLDQISEQYELPRDQMQAYFSRYGRSVGWNTLLAGAGFWMALLRTVLVTFVSLAGITVLSVFTGYGLAGLRRRDQMAIYNLYLLEMVIPPMLIIVPQFLLVQDLQRLVPGSDVPGAARYVMQLLTLVLIYIKGGAFTTMVFTSAINGIPRELEESTQLDGCSRLQYLRYFLLPLLKVPIATAVVILLPDLWNRFLEPYIYLDQANTVVLPLIQTFAGKFSTNYQVIFTGVLVSILPLLIVYVVFRRLFIRGVMSGAVKG